jgi:hypothetical protein
MNSSSLAIVLTIITILLTSFILISKCEAEDGVIKVYHKDGTVKREIKFKYTPSKKRYSPPYVPPKTKTKKKKPTVTFVDEKEEAPVVEIIYKTKKGGKKKEKVKKYKDRRVGNLPASQLHRLNKRYLQRQGRRRSMPRRHIYEDNRYPQEGPTR